MKNSVEITEYMNRLIKRYKTHKADLENAIPNTQYYVLSARMLSCSASSVVDELIEMIELNSTGE